MRSFSILALLLLPQVSAAQPGYTEGQAVFLPDSAIEVFRNGSFRIEVIRSAPNTEDRTLIERAERLYPSRAAIDSITSTVTNKIAGERLAKAALIAGDRWWWDDADWFLTPFALTGAAVQHYVERLRIMAAEPVQIGPPAPPSGLVKYTARVIPSGSEAGGREVEMRIVVEVTCGARCGLNFTHSRSVVFDTKGRVIRVVGDGQPIIRAS